MRVAVNERIRVGQIWENVNSGRRWLVTNRRPGIVLRSGLWDIRCPTEASLRKNYRLVSTNRQ